MGRNKRGGIAAIRFLSDDSEAAKKSRRGTGNPEDEPWHRVSAGKCRLQNTTAEDERCDFDLVFAGWGADYNDPMSFLDLWVTDGPYNDVGWSNDRYDELITQAKKSTDQQERMELMAEAERSFWMKAIIPGLLASEELRRTSVGERHCQNRFHAQ